MLPHMYIFKPSLTSTFMLNIEALTVKVIELTHTDIPTVLTNSTNTDCKTFNNKCVCGSTRIDLCLCYFFNIKYIC